MKYLAGVGIVFGLVFILLGFASTSVSGDTIYIDQSIYIVGGFLLTICSGVLFVAADSASNLRKIKKVLEGSLAKSDE
jgi:hypothetical protein